MNDLALFGIIIIYLIICTALGFVRGLAKTRIRVITVAGAALVSFVLSLLFKNSIFDDSFFAQMGGALAFSDVSIDSAMRMITLVEATVGMGNALIMPLVFVGSFIGLCLLTWIIHLIVTLVLRRRLKQINEQANHKLLQIILLNLLQGMIVVFIVLVPVNVYSQTASTVVDIAEEVGALDGMPDAAVMVDDYIDPINESFLIRMHRVTGGNLVSRALTDFSVNGSVVRLDDELETVARVVLRTTVYMDETDRGLPSDLVRLVANSYEDSVLIPSLTSELIYELTGAWNNGTSFLEIKRPDSGELMDPLMTDLINVLYADSKNPKALRADLYTIADLIDIMREHGVMDNLSNDEALKDMMGSNGVVKAMTEKLEQNATMYVMVPTIKNIGMRAIATTLDLDGAGRTEYDGLLGDISGALNSTVGMDVAERVEVITDEFTLAFSDAGVEIDRDVVRSYSVSFIEQFGNDENVTSDEVADFLQTYAVEN